MSSTTTRDRILDALSDILISQGSSAVTLESVAAAADVSKGGLLYHFPSKQAMIAGLVQRLSEEAEREFAAAEQAEEGLVRAYLEGSLPSSPREVALYWSLIASLRSQELASPDLMHHVHEVFSRWARMLHAAIPDPVLAENIRLVGDGLYLTAISGLPMPDETVVRQLMDRLVHQAEQAQEANPKPGPDQA
ncbi:TetR/AcrR family transcriptional regulator [Lipingzhangella sp. LS1_29]|uniref:TetR/AcrR family transcriptional regulator n=1 Tax=Lipingzhangella rawalii TaxID=2055835 RepID=A0ABU2H4R4_9ACTN|nr:TetR/AcrR family transcriptional regulator [Lipingzhangella rawalii]MDS1269599.1 TetR/AcrR family transcriptional regulator [Lipingzhangella rawalii]